MKKVLYFIVFTLLLFSCGGQNDSAKTELKDKITNLEDSMTIISQNLKPGEIMSSELHEELIGLLKEYSLSYSDDVYAPEYLDKLHLIYSGRGDYAQSTKYADTLINNYPDYINRAMILESQAIAYDFNIKPRDTSKVRYYYELLLNEYPDLPQEKSQGIKSRLKNLHLTIEEIMKMQ
jgi:tetratricopeptide (TPR) repeat protein